MISEIPTKWKGIIIYDDTQEPENHMTTIMNFQEREK